MSRPQTLIELLEDRAGHDPAAIAFEFQDRRYRFGELTEAVDRVARILIAQGLEHAGRIVVALGNGFAFFAIFYGIQKAGGVPVPTFPGSGPERLARLAERCEARFIVAEGAPTTLDGNPDPVSEDDKRSTARTLDAATLLQKTGDEGRGFVRFPPVDREDLAYIQFTSGTTGDPKGVQLSHQNVLINIRQLTAGFAITSDDVFVSWLPAYHDMGLVLMTMVPFALGARLVLLPASLRSLRPWLTALEQHRGTFTAAPDFGYRMALRLQQGDDPPDLSSVRVALNAAEPVRAGTIAAFESAFDLRSVMIAGYGLAEATVGVSAWHPGRAPLVDERGSVSVGQPFSEIEIAIVGETGRVGPGELGEIAVHSPANTRGYWATGSTKEPTGEEPANGLFAEGGFLRTGDLGYLDAAGNLFVCGRLKQMIIQAGRNIAPREVEEIIDALPFARRSAAIGIDRGDTAGEQLYVFAEMRESSKPDDAESQRRTVAAVSAIHSHLGLRPGRVYLCPPRTIPFTANGKVRYGELKEAYRSGRLRSQGQLWYPPW